MKSFNEMAIAARLSGVSNSHNRRTAGKIEFIRDQGPLRRDIRVGGFDWSSESLRNLAKILWATQRSHSYAVSALRMISKMPSSSFSPDGLLGGRGYIQSIKDMRTSLGQAVEVLSNFTDTLYDEVNAGHWDAAETKDSNKMVQKAEEVKSNPEQFVERQYENDVNPEEMLDPNALNPSPEDFGEAEEDGDDAGGGSEAADNESQGLSKQAASTRKLSIPSKRESFGMYQDSVDRILSSRIHTAGANSSLPVDTMSGPRIEAVGPGSSEYGFFNDPSALPSDDPGLTGFRNDTNSPYEDGLEDGVTGYGNPDYGDNSKFKAKVSSEVYSMLPGSNNQRIMPVYTPDLTESEIKWMVDHSDPMVYGKPIIQKKVDTSYLWGK